MRIRSLSLFLMVALSGCAHRTYYYPHGSNGGYSEAEVGKNNYVARFVGNRKTDRGDARAYAHLRAIEICRGKGFKIALQSGEEDLTQSATVRKTSSYANVTGTTWGGATGVGAGQSWDETYIYPAYEVAFSCTNAFPSIGATLREISRDDAKLVVKDLMGVIQVEEIPVTSPNANILEVGDFLVRIGGKRVRSVEEVRQQVNSGAAFVPAHLIRDGKNLELKLRVIDSVGYVQEEQNGLIRSLCSVSEIKPRAICAK